MPGALLGAALYPLGLDAPVWLYVGAGIKFILWVARFIAAAPGSTLHLRAFAPVRAAVPGACRHERGDLADLGFPRERDPLRRHRPDRRDAADRATTSSSRRRAKRRRCATPTAGCMIVGKRFNAFAAEQWLTADGDGRDPAKARDPDAACDRGRRGHNGFCFDLGFDLHFCFGFGGFDPRYFELRKLPPPLPTLLRSLVRRLPLRKALVVAPRPQEREAA